MMFSTRLLHPTITLCCAAAVITGWLAIPLATGTRAADVPEVGDVAPAFELVASDGQTYKLADFKGKRAVVVAWFPKAFTGGCTMECKSITRDGGKIRDFDVAYFMASVDTAKENAAFAESLGADFPILADPDKKVADAYGVLTPSGYARRWTFYIGLDGRIQAVDKRVNPATSAADIVAKLEELGVDRSK